MKDDNFIPSFSINKLPRISLGDFKNLPDSPGIYFALDGASRVWYIGISTTSLRNRHSNHEKMPEFKDNNIQHIAFFIWNDIEELESWEIGYIQKFNPPLNLNHKAMSLPQINLGYSEGRFREIKSIKELKPNLVTLLENEGGKISDKKLGISGYLSSILRIFFKGRRP